MPLFERLCTVRVASYTGQADITLTGYRFSFKVKKTQTPAENTATLNIYNLKDDTRNKIKSTDDIVSISAGYKDDIGERVIFIGNVINAVTIREPPDIITRLELMDGAAALKTRVSKSYREGIDIKQILKDLCDEFPIAKKLINYDKLPSIKTNGAFVHVGLARDALDKACLFLGAKWSIQDNVLTIIPNDFTEPNRTASIGADSGMIGSPNRKMDIINRKKDEGRDVPGWIVKCLLNPVLQPNSKVEVHSKDIPAGTEFKVWSLEHVGDTFGDDWYTNLELISINV